jgi:predicted transcriptional regulator
MPDFMPEPAENPTYTTASFYLEEDMVTWLDDVAQRTNRSRSNALAEILRKVREADRGR